MPCRATQDRWVTVDSSDKTWSSGEGNDKPLQHSCLENPMNNMKRRGKPTEIEQRKVRGPECGPQVKQTAFPTCPISIGQGGDKCIKGGSLKV